MLSNSTPQDGNRRECEKAKEKDTSRATRAAACWREPQKKQKGEKKTSSIKINRSEEKPLQRATSIGIKGVVRRGWRRLMLTSTYVESLARETQESAEGPWKRFRKLESQ